MISALLWAGAQGGAGSLMMLGYLAPLPVMVVGLGWGPGLGALAILVGFVLALLFSKLFFGILYGVIVALPSWIMLRLAMVDRVMPDGSQAKLAAGPILGRFSAFAAGFLLLAALAHLGTQGGFQGAVEGYLDKFVANGFPTTEIVKRRELINFLLPFFPAMSIGMWMLIVVLNTVIAQTFLGRVGKNVRETPAYTQLQVPQWSYWLFAGTALVSLFASGGLEYLASNMVFILAVPFLFAGLSAAHTLARRMPSPGAILTGFYIILLVFGWAALFVMVVGFFEPWMNLRGRFGQGPGPQEEEEE
ncbi:MAG: DUF2232 domain-containing protein [Rhodospirillales bacterium]|nr:DUF2232 domain-containing protein [Rhodospirillales bacterium]